MQEATGFSGEMNARDQATQLSHQVLVVKLRRPAAATRRYRYPEMVQVVQCLSLDCERWNYRDVIPGKLEGESVFLKDSLVGPAARPVELGNDGRIVLDTDLVDAIFVAIERQESTVAVKADVLERGKNIVWLQSYVGQR